MKLLNVVLLLTVVGCATAAYIIGNGRPDCETEEEVNIRIFRHNWDPTAYWKCVALNEPAVLVRCPDQMGFMESLKDCVSWGEWQWEEPFETLSKPNEI